MEVAPFMRKDENGKNRANWIRILEGVLIGLIVAGVTSLMAFLFMVPAIRADINSIKKDISKIETVIDNHGTRIRDAELRFAAHSGKNNGRH